MSVPNALKIRASAPLGPHSQADRLAACNVCGRPSEALACYRACDERDRVIPGDRALVFLGADHPDCRKALTAHPRMFRDSRGEPGHFPRLCGRCRHRDGLACRHPDLKANGGPGLRVDIENFGVGFACGPGGCRSLASLGNAMGCAGLERRS